MAGSDANGFGNFGVVADSPHVVVVIEIFYEFSDAHASTGIADLCHDAQELGATEVEANLAADFLKYRRDNLRKIVTDHRGEFRAIRQWSLIQ